MAAISEVLASRRTLEIVQRHLQIPTSLAGFFNFGITGGGGNVSPIGGRHFNFDTYRSTDMLPKANIPAKELRLREPRPVGTVRGEFPRLGERISLSYEQIHNQRPPGENMNILDTMGEAYIMQQQDHIGDLISNFLEFQTAAMLRGSYYYSKINQETVEMGYDAITGAQKIDFQGIDYRAGQTPGPPVDSDGNAIIDASWATASTDIPGHLIKLNEYQQANSRWLFNHVICAPIVWNYIINNSAVATQGGTSVSPFSILTRDEDGNFTAMLRSVPWLTFHIIGSGMQTWVDATPDAHAYTPVLEQNMVYCVPTPAPNWITYGLGSEIVVEGPGGPASEQTGFYPYSYESNDPAGHELCYVMNGIPWLKVPEAVLAVEVVI